MSAVLVVDDQPPVREFLVRWLGPAGYETAQAPDAEAALSLLAERSFDVVLCDVQMPGRGGLWLVDQLRDHEARHGRQDVPIVPVDRLLGADEPEQDQRHAEHAQVINRRIPPAQSRTGKQASRQHD